METREEREKAKRDRELKAMNNERTREVVHSNEPKRLTKKQQEKVKNQEKKNKAAKKRRQTQAKKRYNARVWRGWRESDGEKHPVIIKKASELDKD